jgi:dCMP deaminase
MKTKFALAFMEVAETFAKLSTAKKLQVGAVIVKDNRIISIGYNGTPTGWDNVCEDLVPVDVDIVSRTITPAILVTRPEVIHAESNAITKVAASTESCKGAVLFCTHTPCMECAKLIYQSGISTVYIRNEYFSAKSRGDEFLKKCNVEVINI